MTLAFFAPLKSPNHPVPSGDRAMARALMVALKKGGYNVELVSELRLYEKLGDKKLQAVLRVAAETEISRLLQNSAATSWKLWVTYHNYYKAPDLVGPAVSQALGIPYVQIESSRARKRLIGPWADFEAAAEFASNAADTIFYFTQRDAKTLYRDAPEGQKLVHLAPFLSRTDLPKESSRQGPFLNVGMMRYGDKLDSYQLVADVLALLPESLDWRLNIVGDGPARSEVEQMMAPYKTRVKFLGIQSASALAEQYAHSSLFFWPGVNEAFGLVYLEAQAAGLPVVAQNRPGVRDVVFGAHPLPGEGAKAMANQIMHLMTDQSERDIIGQSAREKVQSCHLLDTAAQTLNTALEVLM